MTARIQSHLLPARLLTEQLLIARLLVTCIRYVGLHETFQKRLHVLWFVATGHFKICLSSGS